MDPRPSIWHSLSPHSVCKKSSNLLAALLPLPDLSLKQCQRWVCPCAGKGGFPRVIRPKKECIKYYETYFANTFSLNDKGPYKKRVCSSPKFYGPLAIWPWLRISPHSSLSVIYCVIISAWQWLMSFTHICPVFLCKLNPIKACPGKGQAGPLFHWESTPYPPFSPFSSTGFL